MKKQIEDFYFNMNLPVSAIIDRLLQDRIHPSIPSIQAALESIWKQSNKKEIEVKRSKMVNEVRKKAKYIEASEKKDVYTYKYESERKELKQLRNKKAKFEQNRRLNLYDLTVFHIPYWIMIVSILVSVYFLGSN